MRGCVTTLAVVAMLILFPASRGRAADAAEQPIRLWPGRAPGSENWSLPESLTQTPTGDRIVRNVSEPTLSVFLPDRQRANGAAVVVLPGGALRVLGFDNEGVKVARWLNERGIAAFVLKYRTLQMSEAPRLNPSPSPSADAAPPREEITIRNANANPDPGNAALAEVLTFAIEDARAAMRLVRGKASTWHVDPHRVGLMGFSAGGGVALGLALAARSDATPDFLVSLYGPSLMDVQVRSDSPALFVAVGSQHFNVTSGLFALAAEWRKAGRPVEMHVYDGVSSGFGMTSSGLPVDGWKDRFHEWLIGRGLVPR